MASISERPSPLGSSSPPPSKPASPTSSTAPEDTRRSERLEKKERRKSLGQRLVAWGLQAHQSVGVGPSKPRQIVGAHKVKGGRVAGLAQTYDSIPDRQSNTVHLDDGDGSSHHDDEYTAGHCYEGSNSADAVVGLRYKRAAQGTELHHSSPEPRALLSPARQEFDPFRSDGNLPPHVKSAQLDRQVNDSLTDIGGGEASQGGQKQEEPTGAIKEVIKQKYSWRSSVFGKKLCASDKKSRSEGYEATTDGDERCAAEGDGEVDGKGDGEGISDVSTKPKKKKKIKKTKMKERKRRTKEEVDDEDDGPNEVSTREHEAEVSIHVLIKRGDVEDIKRLVTKKSVRGEKGEDHVVNTRNSAGSTPLHTAVEVDNLEIVQLLLKNGANPDLVDRLGWSPLLVACKAGNLPMAKALLVDGKADANAKTNDLNTPLHYLVRKSPNEETKEAYYEVMTKLLGKEGKVYGMVANNTTSRNKNGDTPLHYAALFSKPEVVQWLLQHHAAVNNQNTYGDTALHCAARRGDVEIVQLLLKGGASKNLSGRSGTPKEVVKVEHADNAALLALV